MVLADYGSVADEALPHLERLLGEDELTRVTAVHAILCIDPSRTEELTPILVEALSNGDKMVRQRAAQVLGDTPAAGAVAIQSLVQALGDEDETVRLIVLNTLNNLGTGAAPATPVLVKILADSDAIIERGLPPQCGHDEASCEQRALQCGHLMESPRLRKQKRQATRRYQFAKWKVSRLSSLEVEVLSCPLK